MYKNSRLILTFFILFALLYACNNINLKDIPKEDNSFYVEGVIRDIEDTTVYLTSKPFSEQIAPDTLAIATMKDGFFSFNGKTNGPMVVELSLEGQHRRKKFVLENTKQYLDIYWSGMFNYSGGKYHNRVVDLSYVDFEYYLLSKRLLGDQLGEVWKYLEDRKAGIKRTSRTPRDPKKMKLLKEAYVRKKQLQDSLLQYDNDPIYKALLLSYHHDKGTNIVWKKKDITLETIAELKELDSNLDVLKNLQLIMNERIAFYENEKLMDKGNNFETIVLKNKEEEDVDLKKVLNQNKYVFIDFWASWCGPCRLEFPYIEKAYDEYKDKGFEVYAISVDEKYDSWLKALDEEKVHWVNTIVPKDKIKEIRLKYNVEFVPSNFLLDRNGTIVARDLRREKLSEKLNDLFN